MPTKKFEKGHTKIGGRKKGTPNKIQLPIREKLTEIIEDYLNGTFMTDLAGMEPWQRASIIERFAQYSVPKYQSQQAEIKVEGVKSIEEELGELAEE